MIKKIGKYNVDYEGKIYDGKIPYELIIIEEFNNNDKPVGNRKVLYFRSLEKDIVPKFNAENEIEKFLKYRNYSKIVIEKKFIIKEVK